MIFEVEFSTSDGNKIPVEVHSKTVDHKGKKVILSLYRDITDRKQWQQKIWNFAIQAEEKERGRIARDLHDGLGPILSAIKIHTQWLSNPDKVTNAEYITGELNRTIDEAIVCIKEISANLSPHLLSNHGLVPAIKAFIDKLKKASTTRFNFQADLNERLNSNCEITIYRIFTECINNSIKYANADSIDIKLYKEKDMIKMLIEDDGIGFDVRNALNKDSSSGLINITNRIKNIGGNIEIKSKMGEGTRITVRINNE
jgi:signal transduction histidine kinase